MSRYTNAQVADALDAARELMNNRGKHWTKGASKRFLRKEKGKPAEFAYCSIGSIYAACGRKTVLRNQCAQALSSELKRQNRSNSIVRFNDSPKTTWEDVSKVFRSTAKRLRKTTA